MIPIEKNIFVVDEQGNTYEATYPKRAKGLVKSGRARFIDENTICLACPPKMKLEDKTMSENMINEVVEQSIPEAAEHKTPEAADQKTVSRFTVEHALERLDAVSRDTAYLTEALAKLTSLESKGPGDISTGEQARAIAEVVKARERTNQLLIEMYRQMYKYLRPEKPNADMGWTGKPPIPTQARTTDRMALMSEVIQALANSDTPEESMPMLNDIFKFISGNPNI